MSERRQRLRSARLYLVCEDLPDAFLEAALRGGVDIVQLRSKGRGDQEILVAARRFASICRAHDALFILNDRPDLVAAAGADGVHVGQEDLPVAHARELVGQSRLVGLSTHTPDEIDRVTDADYIGVGPVFQTPTKPGRPAVGLELVRYAAILAQLPFFAIGGISASNVEAVRDAGAERISVVRALTNAPDPLLAARELREALSRGARVGAA